MNLYLTIADAVRRVMARYRRHGLRATYRSESLRALGRGRVHVLDWRWMTGRELCHERKRLRWRREMGHVWAPGSALAGLR